MVDKWYDDPNCDWFDEEQEHRRILKRRIESACKIAIVVSLLFIVGLVGSAELGNITLGQFFAYELVAIATFIISLRVGANL